MGQETWSASESTVLAQVRDAVETDSEGVLATVLAVEGNAYRRPGAKMFVPSDGEGVGSITAGCLEGEVVQLANEVLDDGVPRIETFDLMEDDDVWGLGVGCNGIIDLLLEPVDRTFEPLVEAYDSRRPSARLVATESDDDAVERWQHGFYAPGSENGTNAGTLPDWIYDEVRDAADELLDAGTADTVRVEGPNGTVELFVDGIAPPPRLLIVGTGHDVDPLVELGNRSNFRTTVVGYRGATATVDRFPDADDVVSTSPGQLRESVSFDEDTYPVVMTHNFVDDRLTIEELLETPVPYIGLMGPRERFEEMVEAFRDEGRTFSDAELERIYTPVGLDLGGGTPYQIAISIVSEVTAVRNDREPVHLTTKEGPIHSRIDVDT